MALKKETNIYAFIIKTRNKYYTSELRKGLINAQNELNIYKYKLTIIETHIDSPREQLQELKRVIREEKVDRINYDKKTHSYSKYIRMSFYLNL